MNITSAQYILDPITLKNACIRATINEIVSLIKVPSKNYKLRDKDLVDLLQYCDLVDELETANG